MIGGERQRYMDCLLMGVDFCRCTEYVDVIKGSHSSKDGTSSVWVPLFDWMILIRLFPRLAWASYKTRRLQVPNQIRIIQSSLNLFISRLLHTHEAKFFTIFSSPKDKGMCSAPGSVNIRQVMLLTLVQFLAMTCGAKSRGQCFPSSCGDIRNISYPFRLKSDPKGCGYWELACEDNRTVQYDVGDSRYYVQSIDYSNNRIRYVDDGLQKDNCSSLPRHTSMGYLYHSSDFNVSALIIVNCSKPVDSPFYIATDPCVKVSYSSNTSSNWNLYALVNPKASDIRDFCAIQYWTWLSYNFGGEEQVNSSSYDYERIHDIMADGYLIDYGYDYGTFKTTFFCYFDLYHKFHNYRYFNSRRLATSYSGGQVCGSKIYTGGVLDDIAFWTTLDITILLVLFCVAKFVIGMPFVVIFLIYKYKRRHLAMDQNIEEFLQAQNNFFPIRYSYSNIKKITNNFKHKLGEGGYGYVYKGTLKSGNEVAIKILKQSKANGQDFISEVATIGRIHHVNIVQLIGFCFEGSKQALIYDFMSNGSLDKHIFTKEGDEFLHYKKIHEITLGVARGIEYLHQGCDMQILHFDIKPHNILLDQHFTPKVSDFGLARLYPTNHSIISLTAARGTLGYMAPELFYKSIGGVSYKADVYSFGMLLMEMASRRKNINANAEHSSQVYFPLWVYDQVNEGESIEMEEVVAEDREVMKKIIIVALWCIQLNPDHRPPMRKVLEMLEGDIRKLQMPPKPLIYPQEEPINIDKAEMKLETFSTSSSSQIISTSFPFGDSDNV